MGSRLLKKGRNPGVADNWLDSLGLYRKNVAFDETCLFRATSEQIYDCQVHHERVRKECIEFARQYWALFYKHFESVEDFFDHLDLLENHMVVCGNVEIEMISYTYGYDVLVYNATHHTISNVTQRNLSKKLRFCLIEDHYDVIYKKEQIEAAGFCQSIVYKILYEEVFKIPDVDNIVNGMLYDKSKVITQAQMKALGDRINVNLSIDDLQNCGQPGSNESISVAPFPFKVAKALDPTIYRNIEYDSWGEVRREMRLGEWYHGDDNLTLGTKCIYHRNDDTFECYIQELFKETNECVVFLTKSAERLRVNYTDLSPEDDAKPWPLPYRFSKNLVISNSIQSATDKLTKSPKKQLFKDKRRTKSCSESLAVTRPVLIDNSDKLDNIHLFLGDPLQIRPSTENIPDEFASSSPPNQEPAFLNLNEPNNDNIFDQSQWHLMSQTANPFIWPTTPTTTPNMFNFPPMIASAPVTPDVIPYHNQNFPFYYNCHVEPTTPNYYPWSNQMSSDCFLSPPPENSPQELQSGGNPSKNTQSVNDNQQTVKEIDFSQLYSSAQQTSCTAIPNALEKNTFVDISSAEAAGQQEHHVQERPPTICRTNLSRQNSMEMYSQQYAPYSPIIPIPPPPQTIMYSPQVPEMMVPQQPYTVFTPTVDIQYVSPNPPYVYPPTPPATWYPAGINSQGFIFPPPTTAQNNSTSN